MAAERRWMIVNTWGEPCLWEPMFREENAEHECGRLNAQPDREGYPFRVVDTGTSSTEGER